MAIRKLIGVEPDVRKELVTDLEFHGNEYSGWSIPKNSLDSTSIVVDVGLGEDIAFSISLIQKYGCLVHGFDPTPRAIDYVARMGLNTLRMHPYGLSAQSGSAKFYLPKDRMNVSGSIYRSDHVGNASIIVPLLCLEDVMRKIGVVRIDLLKLDIEGAEYDVISGESFRKTAPFIKMLCVEFHHRWPDFRSSATDGAIARLRELGFVCAWSNPQTNEEFLFINQSIHPGLVGGIS